ncbi:MAG: imidazole glycerol phosphate synthase subunit HisH [Candidatus Diapherotrites archaeon]|nr:imidazole glycerol phosphate synthase subunit HisH [Candidatus Diapherotrites archaeon]
MNEKISILKYGLGNTQSLANALEKMQIQYEWISKPKQIQKAKKIIVPGVGNFGTAMKNIRRQKLKQSLTQAVQTGTPYLGICLGLQILFEESQESKGIKGLGILKGKIQKFQGKEKIPQMGWNRIQKIKTSPLFEKIPNKAFMYFVHSYYAKPKDKKIVAGTTEYGETFPCVIQYKNIYGTQFHPEKSGTLGLQILRNFAGLRK